MNELIYSFIGSLRAWLRENEYVLEASNIKVDILPYTFHYGIGAQFIHEYLGASFHVWEKRYWHLAMSDVEFVDWRVADKDPNYQVEWMHYEFATIKEMWKELDKLRDRLILTEQTGI